MVRSSSWIGLLLVVGGAVYMLSMFHLVHLPAIMWSSDTIWALVLIILGLSGLRGFRRTVPWGALFLFLYGVFLFCQSGLQIARLTDVSPTGVFWSLLFIYLGISVFAPKRLGGWKPKVVVNWNRRRSPRGPQRPPRPGTGGFGDNPIDVPFESVDEQSGQVEIPLGDMFGDFKNWSPKHHTTRHFIGDVSLGSEPWVMEDMSVWNGVGDVRINLATAHLEDKTYHIRVEGWVGDVRILVPASIPVSVQAEVNLGDVNVFEHAESGTGRNVYHTDVSFDTAVRRVQIDARLKIGDVQIVRV